MDKQTFHGTGWSEGSTLEIQERPNGIEITMRAPSGKCLDMFLADKKEFMDALVTMYEQLEVLPF